MQNVDQNGDSDSTNDVKSTDVDPSHLTPPSLENSQCSQVLAAIPQHFIPLVPSLSPSDEEDTPQIDSFMLGEDDLDDGDPAQFLLTPENIEGADVHTVDPETQARLEALLEAAGIGKLSTGDGKAFADPEVLRRLTSSVSCALDEAAAALTRMRAEQQGEIVPGEQGTRSLAKACSSGDIGTVRQLLDEGMSVHETTEEGESLLSLACSAGYFELAQVLLAMRANVEDRGIKGDCTPLMEAATGGYVEIVKLLISHEADVNAQSAAGNTPLHYAACGGHQEAVHVLLGAGANVEEHNENGHTPLMEAASAGHVTVAKILLEAGAGINTHSNEFKESALTLACYKGHLDMVKFLLEAGADQEHKTDEMHTALMEASMDGHVEVARLLLDSGAQVNMPADSFESPLTLAACGGHVELANLLIERGANLEEVNDEGYTPLMEASREGHEEMVALLLAHGADINAQTEETQETALTLACCGGFLEVADFLIKAGADIEVGCSTPLMEAAQEGHLELVKYLLKAEANVHSMTQTGDTALTYACENGHTAVAEVLLDQAAHLEHESEGGRTPLMKAARAGHHCTVQFLIEKGADVNRETSTNDHTVLSLACAGGHLAVVELLLRNGADSTHKLKDGSTMLIEAAKGGHTTVVNLLLDWPNNTLSPTADLSQLSPPQSTVDVSELPRVPMQGLTNVVPPQDPNQIAVNTENYIPNIQSNIVQMPGQINLKDLNIPTRQNMPLGMSKGKNQAVGIPNESGGMDPLQDYTGASISEEHFAELEADFGEYEHGYMEDTSPVPLDLDDSPDLKASERLEAFINKMMQKAESLSITREEQILRKQQILEELQKVEQELQEKAKAQLLLNAQERLEQERESQQLQEEEEPTEEELEEYAAGLTGCRMVPSLQEQSAAVARTQGPLPLHVALKNQLMATQAIESRENATAAESVSSKDDAVDGGNPEEPSQADDVQAPHLAKQESLSSASSADSGCGNSDTTSAGKDSSQSETNDASAKISPPKAIDETLLESLENVELPQHNSTTDYTDTCSGREEVEGQEDCDPEDRGSRASSEEVDISNVVPVLESSAQQLLQQQQQQQQHFDQHMQQPLQLTLQQQQELTRQFQQLALQQQLQQVAVSQQQQQVMEDGQACSQHSQAPTVIQPLQQEPIPLTAILEPLQSIASTASTAAPGSLEQQLQQQRQLQAQLALHQQFKVQAQLQLQQQQQQPQLQSPQHTANKSLLYTETQQVKLETTNMRQHANTQEAHQLKLQQVQQHLQQLHQQLQQVQQLQTTQQMTHHELLQQAQQLQQQLQQAQLQQLLQQQQQQVANSSGVPVSQAQHAAQLLTQQDLLQQAQQLHQQLHQAQQLTQLAQQQKQQLTQLQKVNGGPDSGQKKTLQQQQLWDQQASQAQPLNGNYSLPTNTNNPYDCIIENMMTPDTSAPLTPNPSPASPQISPPVYPSVDLDAETESNHDTALTLSCAGGHAELVSLLLQRGADIEHRDKKGFTPLILAATAGHSDVVDILFNHDADIEAQSERTKDTPLSLACSGGRYEVVELLLKKGANKEHRNVSDYTPLSLAASGGYVNIIKLLLTHGAEINSRTGSKLGISPLMLAAMNGHTAAVRLLLDDGSDINAQIETNRNTALTLACFQGRHEVVSLLVDRKANIEHRAKTGLTPLMEAASGGYVEVGRVLLDKGADVNAPPVPSSRDTALTIAADKGHYRFVELLLSKGAAIDVKNKKGNSPLWLACNGGHLDVVQLLVNANADVDSQDNRKVSCLMSAFRKGHVKVIKWLVKHVAQFPSDQECMRFIATVTDKELLKKCHQCMEIIVSAKDRQAAEANKYASILLEEIDMERNREEKKKQSMAKKREKRRKKKKEKREREQGTTDSTGKNSSPEPDGPDDDDCKDDEDDGGPEDALEESVDQIEDISLSTAVAGLPITSAAMLINLPAVLPVVSRTSSAMLDTTTANGTTTTTATYNNTNANRRNNNNNRTNDSKSQGGPVATRTKNKRNRKEKGNSGKERNQSLANNNNNSKADPGTTGEEESGEGGGSGESGQKPEIHVPTLSSTGIGDLDDFMEMLPSNSAKPTPAKEKEKRNNDKNLSRVSSLDTFGVLSPNKSGGGPGKQGNTPSPKKGQRREEGWKEVIRKSKKISVPANAISRVIGRSGSNLNAIREVSGAHIEVDRARGHHDRNITIKGSAEATRQAHSLIVALVKDPERDLDQIIPKLRSKVQTTNTDSITSNMWHNSMANNIGTTATTTVCSASITIATTLKSQSSVSTSVLGRSISVPAEHVEGMSNSGVITTGRQNSANAANSCTSQAQPLGSFPPMGVWGAPSTNSSTSSGKHKVSLATAGGLKIIARQLFPTDQEASSALSCVTKTTVTYSSPSMAKTKVVPSSSASTAARVETQRQQAKQGHLVSQGRVQQQQVNAAHVMPPKLEPQPLPIKTANLQGMQVAPQSISVPISTAPGEYSPFNNRFSQVADQVLGKKDENEGRKNFASVAAAGVIPAPSPVSKVTVPAPIQNKVDPSLQAKAPGYKAPGQRTSSPHLNDPDFSRVPGFRQGFPSSGLGVGGEIDPMNRVPGFQRGPSLGPGYPTPPPQQQQQHFNDDFAASGFSSAFLAALQPPGTALQARIPGYNMFNMPPFGTPGRSMDHSPPHHRDEYSTPDQPMTLPRIDSNLNPNAPDFTSRSILLRQQLQLQSQLAVGAASHYGPSGPPPPPVGSSPGPGAFPQQPAFRPPPTINQQSMGVAGPPGPPGSTNGLPPPGSVGLRPPGPPGSTNGLPPHGSVSLSELNTLGFLNNNAGMNLGIQVGMPRQYSPMTSAPRSSSASSLGASSRDGTSPVPGVSGEVSPSSSAPSPTEQLRGLNMPRPIGTERIGKKGVLSGMDLAAATLWSTAEPGSDWSTKVSSVVTSTTVLASGAHSEVEEPRPSSLPAPSHFLTGNYPLDPSVLDPSLEQALQGQAAMLVPGSSAVFANGVPAGAAQLPQIPPIYQSAGVPEGLPPSMWNPALKLLPNPQEQPTPPDARMWNNWTPPPTM